MGIYFPQTAYLTFYILNETREKTTDFFILFVWFSNNFVAHELILEVTYYEAVYKIRKKNWVDVEFTSEVCYCLYLPLSVYYEAVYARRAIRLGRWWNLFLFTTKQHTRSTKKFYFVLEQPVIYEYHAYKENYVEFPSYFTVKIFNVSLRHKSVVFGVTFSSKFNKKTA